MAEILPNQQPEQTDVAQIIDPALQYQVTPVPAHIHNGVDSPLAFGLNVLPYVTSAPTSTPTNGTERLYFDGVNYWLYIYANGSWRSLSLSPGASPTTGIVLDATQTTLTANVNTVTKTHTASGAGLLAIIDVGVDSGQTATSVTYNGVFATLIDNKSVPGNYQVYSYWIAGIPTGASDVRVNTSANANICLGITTYRNCKQTAQPDAFISSTGTVNTFTQAVTTVASRSWIHMCVGSPANAGGGSVGANTFLIGVAANPNNFIVTDSGTAETPAGSYSQTVTVGAGAPTYSSGWILTSIAPI